MHEAGTRVWRFDDETKPSPEKVDPQFSQDTVDPLEAGCARALADVIKHDTDSNYATMAAREFLAMWRFVEDRKPQPTFMSPLHAGVVREDERKRIKKIISFMITERIRLMSSFANEDAVAVMESSLVLSTLQEVLDAIDPPSGPMKPPPVAAREATDKSPGQRGYTSEQCAA